MNYYGFDINMSLINAGIERELPSTIKNEKVSMRNFHADKDFRFPTEWSPIDFAIAFSLFTHLQPTSIKKCLSRVYPTLKTGGELHATVFLATETTYLDSIEQSHGILTFPDKDPFHYRPMDLKLLADGAGLRLVDIIDFNHPRNQKMAIFKK